MTEPESFALLQSNVSLKKRSNLLHRNLYMIKYIEDKLSKRLPNKELIFRGTVRIYARGEIKLTTPNPIVETPGEDMTLVWSSCESEIRLWSEGAGG